MAIALAGAVSSTFAQGTIAFNTRVIGYVDAPVWAPCCPGTTGVGSIPGMKAQLYLFSGSGVTAKVTGLYPATTFFSGTTLANRYVVVPPELVVVPGVPPGQQATVFMRVFDGESFETSEFRGQTMPITITLGGTLPGGTTFPTALLTGLDGDVYRPGAILMFERIRRNGEELEITVTNVTNHSFPWENYVLEGSSDFVSWAPLATNAPSLTTFTMPFPATSKAFYRSRVQGPSMPTAAEAP